MGAYILILFFLANVFIMIICEIMNSKIYISKSLMKCFLLLFLIVFSVSSISYSIKSNLNFDINRHFDEINNMRRFGINYALNDGIYKDLFVINMLMYLVSLTPYNNLFIAIPIVIDMLIVSYIIFDLYKNDSNVKFIDFIFVLFVFFSLFSLKYAFTAVRTNLAVALCSFGLYLDYIKGKNKIVPILFYFLGMFVHYFGAIIVLIRIIMLFVKNKSKKWYLLILGYPLVKFIFEKAYPLNFTYLDNLMKNFLNYDKKFNMLGRLLQLDGYIYLMVLGYVSIILCVLIISKNSKTHKINIIKEENKHKNEIIRIENYIFIVGIFTAVFLPNYVMTERFMMVLSFAVLFYLPEFLKRQKDDFWKIILLIICVYISFWDFQFILRGTTGVNPFENFW